jgi:hypothetical protein
MKHIIYKITNTINDKYYIGRHSTDNVNDGYMGSGLWIKNAIRKYGRENFIKEILDEANSSPELWELEKKYVNEDVVKDENSYNMCVGGKHYLSGLTREELKTHQSMAGKIGAKSFRDKLKEQGRVREWHVAGGHSGAKSKHEKYIYKIITASGETLMVNAVNFKSVCEQHGWNYSTLAWKICNGPKTIKRGPLAGFYIEQQMKI